MLQLRENFVKLSQAICGAFAKLSWIFQKAFTRISFSLRIFGPFVYFLFHEMCTLKFALN